MRLPLITSGQSTTQADHSDDTDPDGEASILAVSRVLDEQGQPVEATGRSVASVQFMITNAMRAQLAELGYGKADIDAMDPPRAAAIIAKGTPSSRQPQRRPKRKQDRFELQFTCKVCEGPNQHSISRHAYRKGTVVVTCPGCQAAHLIADHLNWIEDDFCTLEDYMASRGRPISHLVTDGVAAEAAASATQEESEERNSVSGNAASSESVVDPRRPWRGTKPALRPLSGITDEQAKRIRDAVRQRKQMNNKQGD
jgi:hypothetical protein